MIVEACLNGGRSRDEHPAVPVTAEELARDARAVVGAGAQLLHFHPRDSSGAETLEPGPCAEAVLAVREACPGTSLGLSTGLWIAGGDERRRRELIESWTELPEFVTVNLSEPRWSELTEVLAERGVGAEAAVAKVTEALALERSRFKGTFLRILVEPQERDPRDAVTTARVIDDAVARFGPPRFHIGQEPATWAVIDAALDRRLDVRVGLEDTLTLADGRQASGNAELVAEVVRRRDAHLTA